MNYSISRTRAWRRRDYRVTFGIKSLPRHVCVTASILSASWLIRRPERAGAKSGLPSRNREATGNRGSEGSWERRIASPPRRDSVRRIRNPLALRFAEKTTVLDRAKNTHVPPARPTPERANVCLSEEARRGCRAVHRTAIRGSRGSSFC